MIDDQLDKWIKIFWSINLDDLLILDECWKTCATFILEDLFFFSFCVAWNEVNMIIRCYKGSVQKPQPRNLTAMGGASCPGAFAILSLSNVAKIQSSVIFSFFFMSLTKKVPTEAIMCHLIHGCRCFYPNDIFSKEGKHNMFCSQTCQRH